MIYYIYYISLCILAPVLMEAMVPMMDVRACGRPDSYGQIFDDKKGFTLDGYKINIIEIEMSHLILIMKA